MTLVFLERCIFPFFNFTPLPLPSRRSVRTSSYVFQNQADEQYLASKRYISEKFFNMRISQPEAPGANGVGPIWAGAKGKATSAGDDFGKMMSVAVSQISDTLQQVYYYRAMYYREKLTHACRPH